MSHLGEEIRAQQRVAQHISNDIRHDVQSVHRQLGATVWESSAGNFFRDRLDELARDLAAANAEVDALEQALARHATSVEQHEQAVGEWLAESAHTVGHAVGAVGSFVSERVGEAAHTLEHAVGSGHGVAR